MSTITKKAGRPAKYPWDDWFDGETHRLNRADDFPERKTPIFRAQMFAAASRRGVKINTSVKNDTIKIRAYERANNGS